MTTVTVWNEHRHEHENEDAQETEASIESARTGKPIRIEVGR